MSLALGLLLAAAGAYGLAPRLAAWARRHGWVDRPGAAPHKGHPRPVPLLGGLAVTGAWLAAAAATGALAAGTALGLAAAVAGGLADDARPAGLGPAVKLLLQALAAAAWGALAGGTLPEGAFLLAAMNLWNLADHRDGLCAGLALGTAAALGLGGDPGAALLAAALVGFLPWNRPPARLFLGDAGSQALGFLLGVFLLGATEGAWPGRGVWVLGALVPWLDAGWVTVRRLARGRPPWRGDRRHLGHLLGEGTPLGARGAVVVLSALQFAAALFALGAP